MEITIVCHGGAPGEREELERMLRANSASVARITYVTSAEAIPAVRNEMELRGQRYLAVVDARCRLAAGWLDELLGEVTLSATAGAAAFLPEVRLSRAEPVFAADARCTLIALGLYPAHLRLDEAFSTLDGAIADFLIRGIGVLAGVRAVPASRQVLPAAGSDEHFSSAFGMPLESALSTDRDLVERALRSAPGRRRGLVSIVMLSWNALPFTKLALESIRTYTRGECEVIIVDNGSEAETVEWLRAQPDIRVIFNAENRGFAGGNNQGLATARGEYVVLLNNDVIVTDGWLDGLLDAFDVVPALGVSAPRSNRIAGDQLIPNAVYNDGAQMQEFARERRERFRGQGYLTDRAIGLCLCIDRTVIDEIGGIDERYGAGNFEDDDFCIRVRAAGYRMFVCNDVFIHHFGSQTFAANKVDWTATMRANWAKFAAKWGYPQAYPDQGYAPALAIAQGFDRTRHYVPLPHMAQSPA